MNILTLNSKKPTPFAVHAYLIKEVKISTNRFILKNSIENHTAYPKYAFFKRFAPIMEFAESDQAKK